MIKINIYLRTMNFKFNIKFLSMVILIGLFSSSTFSQNNPIHNLSDRESVFAKENHTALRGSTATTEHPYDLLYDLNATVYAKDNAILNVEGVGAPVVLKFLDTQSFKLASTANTLHDQVELITINLKSANDLRSPFQLNAIQGFNNLKYIYLKCEFAISENQIRTFLQNADPKIVFFYSSYQRS